jgi:DNA-binding NtrC family response regulator
LRAFHVCVRTIHVTIVCPDETMNKKTVLIADPDPAFRESLARFLREHELKTTAFNEMTSALRALEHDHFDIAVVDFCNPGHRDRVRSLLLRRTNGTAIILTCSRHSAETERAARSLSPAFYFVKPIDYSDLLAVILRISELRDRQKMLAIQRMKKREGAYHE